MDHLNAETNFRCQRRFFSDQQELLLKYIWRHQNNEGEGPFEYACRTRDRRASQSNECVEDEDGRAPEHGADGKTPSSPKNWVWYFGWEQPVVG